MDVEAPVEFWSWFEALSREAAAGDTWSRERHDLTLALLVDLAELPLPPAEGDETATLARVRQAERHRVWRASAALGPQTVVRLLCVFPDPDTVVVASVAGDTTRIGDVFYKNVAGRTDEVVDAWALPAAQRPVTFAPARPYVDAALALPGAAERVAATRARMREQDAARAELVAAARDSLFA